MRKQAFKEALPQALLVGVFHIIPLRVYKLGGLHLRNIFDLKLSVAFLNQLVLRNASANTTQSDRHSANTITHC
jgi:hypothetical protein